MAPVILPRKLERRKGRESGRRRIVARTLLIAAVVFALPTFPHLGNRHFWIFDLACQFRVQCFWFLASIAVILLWMRNYRFAVVPTLFALIELAFIAPLYIPHEPIDSEARTARLRLLSFNVHASNREHRLVCDYVRQKSPDVAVFYEINRTWSNQLEQLSDKYPYSRVRIDPESATRGLAIYSRIPLWDTQFIELDDGNWAFKSGMIVESKSFTIFAAHATSPTSAARTHSRNRQLKRLAALIAAENVPVVLAGDLNTTSWSWAFQELVKTTGLCDTRQGFGVQPSWPSALGRFGIPIDHCLVSPEIKVKRRAIGADVGSDHLPLIVDLLFKLE
ncbi:MAG TPA: endonuclease/exonuclease/phosphatase family protein [Planctomycetaceae bacterium]|nr:endonuclease/exonuclease/phosphatase family protein [Planctomycetaceae bacterium]